MIYSIHDLQALVRAGNKDWSQYGDVDVIENDNLLLFNYNIQAQFKGRWNWFELNSRGLILNKNTGEVVARPFPKFFNWGERTNDHNIVEVSEKMDGSLGILYRHKGQYKIATRGSFISEQALWATDFLNKNYNLTGLPEELTLLFEIIYPSNRVVVNYGDYEDLVLIGAIDRFYGRDYYYREIEVIANHYGFAQPLVYSYDNIRNILLAAHDISANEEGWVVRFANGERLKVKGEAYKIAHKFLANVTFDRVLEACADGLFDKMIEGVPDEFLDQVKAYKAYIDEYVNYSSYLTETHYTVAPKESRKDFALYVKANCPVQQTFMFAKLDGRDYIPLIYKQLKVVGYGTEPN